MKSMPMGHLLECLEGPLIFILIFNILQKLGMISSLLDSRGWRIGYVHNSFENALPRNPQYLIALALSDTLLPPIGVTPIGDRLCSIQSPSQMNDSSSIGLSCPSDTLMAGIFCSSK
jgi:hypothetical protein